MRVENQIKPKAVPQKQQTKNLKDPAKGQHAPIPKMIPPVTGPKVLRIAVGRTGGKNFEDRIIKKRENITIGESEKNTFVVPTNLIPSKFVLFELKSDNNYYLKFIPAIKGKLTTPNGIFDLETLQKNGEAKYNGKVFEYKLHEDSKGKIILEDNSILFQFVTAPPLQPKPQLPATLRGGLIKNIDWFFTMLALISFVLHIGFLIWVENTDWPTTQSWEDIPERFARLLVEPPNVEDQNKAKSKNDKGEGEGENDEKAEDQANQQNTSTKNRNNTNTKAVTISQEEREARQAALQARLTDQATQAAMLKLIGAFGGDDNRGSTVDGLSAGEVIGNLDSLMGQVKTVNTGGGGGVLRATAGNSGDGTGNVVAVGDTKIKGGNQKVQTDNVNEREIKGKIGTGKIAEEGGSGILSADSVRTTFKTNVGSIKRCYEKILKRNPNLSGRVTLRFTVSESGRVSDASASNEMQGDGGDEVANCIASTVRSFRFDPPQGGFVTFVYPFIFQPAQ